MLSTEMNWEVVQDFLNVSGIKGVALIDGQSRPYFKGIEKVLNSQQREALAQGVWQVLETIPENFDSFEFQFAGTQVYIHKMTQGLILLVLTHDSLLYPDYCEAFTKLKGAFEADGDATLESFRRLLGARNTTVISPLDAEEESAPVESRPATQVARETAIAQEIAQDLAAQNGQGGAAFTTASTIQEPVQPPETTAPSRSKSRPDLEDTLEDVFAEDRIAIEKAAALEDASRQEVAAAQAAQKQAADQAKAAQQQAAQEKAAKEKAAKEKIAQEKAAQEQAAQKRAAQQQQAAALKRQAAAASNPEETHPAQTPPSRDAAQLADTLVDMADNPFAPAMAAPPDALTETFAPIPETANASGLPEIGLPDVDMPDLGLPDVSFGDVELPDLGLPEVSNPVDVAPSNVASASPAVAPDVDVRAERVNPGIDTEASAQGLPLEDWLTALNSLGQCAVHYLGRAVVVNYWRTSRPESDWLAKFEVERSSHIQADEELPLAHGTTVEQQLELQDWADRFAQRCGRVIRDFPQLAETQGFKPEQRELLGL